MATETIEEITWQDQVPWLDKERGIYLFPWFREEPGFVLEYSRLWGLAGPATDHLVLPFDRAFRPHFLKAIDSFPMVTVLSHRLRAAGPDSPFQHEILEPFFLPFFAARLFVQQKGPFHLHWEGWVLLEENQPAGRTPLLGGDSMSLGQFSPREYWEFHNSLHEWSRWLREGPGIEVEENRIATLKYHQRARSQVSAWRYLADLPGLKCVLVPVDAVAILKYHWKLYWSRPGESDAGGELLERLSRENQMADEEPGEEEVGGREILLSALNPKSMEKLSPTIPWLNRRLAEELEKGETGEEPAPGKWLLDPRAELLEILETARRRHLKEYKEEIPFPYLKKILKFLDKWARLDQRLLPGLYQLVTAAFNFWDNNYAHEVWRVATEYPWLDRTGKFPDLELDFEDLGLSSRKLQAFRSPERPRPGQGGLQLVRRRSEGASGDWKKKFLEGYGICSWPPEDVIIEDYGEFLKTQAHDMLQSRRERVQPFSATLLDGLDYRETIRRIHENRIYVREEFQQGGQAGAVIVIYEDCPDERPLFNPLDPGAGLGDGELTGAHFQDPVANKFNWLKTWWGEHSQESDMAFYSTEPTEMVGPGIARCEYGGFMLSYPPQRLGEIWQDWPDFQFRGRAERLLLAAILYNQEKNIVFVANQDPSSRMVSFARRYGQRIIHIPLTSLNPVQLGRVRRFHVLSDHRARDIAEDYIF